MTALTKRNDIKGLLHMGLFILMVVLTGGSALYAFYHTSIWIFALILYLHWTLFQFFGRVAASHELCHHTVFRTRWVNRVFYVLFTFFAWENRVWFKTRHMSHHQFTAHNGLDGELSLPFIVTPGRWLALFSFDPTKFVELVERNIDLSLGIFDHPAAMLFPASAPNKRREVIRCARELLLGHLILAAAFAWFGLWPLLLIVTLAPFFAQWLNMLVAFPQHIGLQPGVNDFRKNSRTMRLNPVLGFLYCNMQYHIEHHMYAAVPFYNLPKLRKAIEHDLPPDSGGLLSTWKGIFNIWKRQQTEPDWFYAVNLPAPME